MAKKKAITNETERDDALFEALGKNKRRKRRKIIITVIAIVLILAIVAVLGVTMLKKKVQEEFAQTGGEVLSYTVSTGTISTVVSGSGTLSDTSLTSLTLPENVEIDEIHVKTKDTIKEGDVIATVNMSSVVTAMADLQAEIEALDSEISMAEDDEADDIIYSGVTGRIKKIFVESASKVQDTMYEKGALALISLDGYMALDVETDKLKEGDTVDVTLSDGTTVSGTVESLSGSKATVLISDDGPEYDTEASVYKDSSLIGSGKLYIHNQLKITGYAGVIEKIHVKENAKVTAKTKLFTLEDTAYSANYTTLLRTRSEKEETLMELLKIKRDGAVLSEISGSVSSVDYSTENTTSLVTLSDDKKMSVTISVDEADILSLQVGQEVSVSINSISDETFSGVLTEIDKTSASSGTYSAVVELDKTEKMLSGMTATASVEIEGVENAILIPIEALHETSNGAYVYTKYNEELQEYGGKVDVVTGIENSTYIEIKSGLSEGDTVYYTESESSFGSFGSGMPNFSGGGSGMPDFSGGGSGMPNFSGGSSGMPNFSGGGSGGSRPDMSGGFMGRN